MSSTGRSAVRSEADYYPTPSWCVDRLLEEVELPGDDWIEPSAGTGNIIRAVNAHRKVNWTAIELMPERQKALEQIPRLKQLYIGDALKYEGHHDVYITNPPFSQAMNFVIKGLEVADWTVLLLRLNFLGSEMRSAFMRAFPPDVYVLPNRPGFTGDGKTDSIEYAWFVWPPDAASRKAGRIKVLATTRKAERR